MSLRALNVSTQVSYSAGQSTRGDTNCTETQFTEFTLSAASTTSSSNGNTITVSIAQVDLDAIKALTDLAVTVPTTFLAAESGSITDMVGNPLTTISSETVCPADRPCVDCPCPVYSLGVNVFTVDAIAPVLNSVELNMDAATLVTLSFSETVNVSSVRTSELRLQSKNVSDGSTEWHAFSAGTVTQPSHTVLAFVPTVADLNAIKAKQQLAISAESSFFVISPALVSDMNGNAVVAIGNSSMATVRRF